MSEGFRRWWPWLKLVLAVAVVVGLGWHLLRILRTEELSHGDTRSPSEVLWDSIRAANGWGMLLAGLCYLAALGLSAAFWLWLTDSTGEKLPLLAGLRAYYISHLGKYAPGKGLALIMRTGMAAEAGCRASVAVLTAVYETLTTMAAGALLAAILLLFQDGDEGLLWKALGLLALAGVPILPGVFNRVVERLTRRVLRGRISELPQLKGYALLVGLFLNAFGWLLMGASLELMLLAMAPQAGTPGLIASTSFVAVSYVAGFIVLTPGGLGVREWLLANMLLPRLGAEAVVAALVLRLLWTAAEVVMAALVWWLPHKTENNPPLASVPSLEVRMLSLVIPVYNEEESLVPLHDEISAVVQREGFEAEVIFVDDGSRDGSWAVIGDLSRRHPNVHGLRFRRNFGKAAALSAGFRAAKGDIILTLDADLQDDPAEIPHFLAALAHGEELSGHQRAVRLDVVSGWKKKRYDPWHKVLPSRIFNFMVSWLTGVRLHDHNCGMKCYRTEVFKEVKLYGELHRFIPVLAAARGFHVGEIEINHRRRKFGYSKYGMRRFMKGFLDLLTVKFLTGFGRRPQHLLGTVGLISFLLGNLALLWLTITWFINVFEPGTFPPLHQRPLVIYAIGAVLLGAQMMSIGFLAELITAYLSRDEDSYSIAERTDPPS